MLLLILFAFVAGAATAVSPCVLPVLPVVLTAGVTSGRRRPLGIVTGLALSFTFATVALVYVIDALGLPDDFLRRVAIVVLLLFGISLLVPWLSARVEAWLSRLTARAPVRGADADGFWTGVLLGASLGLVYAPCAGPILAGVITVSASQSFTLDRLLIAFAYGIGTAVVLYALMLGGRRLTSRLAPTTPRFQQAIGLVMVLVALAMLADLDTRFENSIAAHAPTFLTNPTHALETTSAAERQLAKVRVRAHQNAGSLGAAKPSPAPKTADAAAAASLRDLGAAPEFVDNQRWFNTPGDRPLTLAGLRGRVVLVDFWTYSCINCLRTLPYLKAWDAKYRRDGLTIVGVHSPEFPFEKDASNVATAIRAERPPLPRRPGQRPRHLGRLRQSVLAGGVLHRRARARALRALRRGPVRGEGAGHPGAARRGGADEARIDDPHARGRAVAGAAHAGVLSGRAARGPFRQRHDPCRRAAVRRAGDAAPRPPRLQRHVGDHEGARDGRRRRGAVAELPRAAGVPRARRSPEGPASVRVALDGKPVTATVAGSDVRDGAVRVTGERLYELVDLPEVGDHVLALRPDGGVQGYAFTFG